VTKTGEKTIQLRLQKWNEEAQQLEPGELVWEEGCHADPNTGVFHLREPRLIKPGQYFLVFPFEGEEGATPYHAETAWVALGIPK